MESALQSVTLVDYMIYWMVFVTDRPQHDKFSVKVDLKLLQESNYLYCSHAKCPSLSIYNLTNATTWWFKGLVNLKGRTGRSCCFLPYPLFTSVLSITLWLPCYNVLNSGFGSKLHSKYFDPWGQWRSEYSPKCCVSCLVFTVAFLWWFLLINTLCFL